jgi:hypothetical protein
MNGTSDRTTAAPSLAGDRWKSRIAGTVLIVLVIAASGVGHGSSASPPRRQSIGAVRHRPRTRNSTPHHAPAAPLEPLERSERRIFVRCSRHSAVPNRRP